MQVGEELVGGAVPDQGLIGGVALRDGPPVRITRRESTVVVEVAGNRLSDGVAALQHLLADLIEGQGNLFVAVELGDDDVVDPDLLAALGDVGARSPRCRLTVVARTDS